MPPWAVVSLVPRWGDGKGRLSVAGVSALCHSGGDTLLLPEHGAREAEGLLSLLQALRTSSGSGEGVLVLLVGRASSQPEPSCLCQRWLQKRVARVRDIFIPPDTKTDKI